MVTGSSICRKVAALLLAVCTMPAPAQESAESGSEGDSDPWGPLKMLEGAWEGAIGGKLGTGEGVRRYEFIMGERFLMARHLSVRLPQEKSPKGDEHEELAVYSIDSERDTVVLREFFNEGIVVRSTCSIRENTVVCDSEAVEGGPGIKARLTLEIENRYRFTENYSIAWSEDSELEHYFTNRWTRVPIPQTWD